MTLKNIYKRARTTLCILSISVGSLLLAQATKDKPTAWTSAKPTQKVETTVATTDQKKSTVVIGQQREQAKPANDVPAKKKSNLKSAAKIAKKAAPELIKQAPALIQSAKTIYAGATGTATAQPQPQQPVYAGQPNAQVPEIAEQEEEEEIDDADRVDEEEPIRR